MLRRPRTLVLLGVFALIPVLIAIGVAVGDRSAPGLIGAIAGNGLVLPVAAMTIALALLLPLAVAMAAADAIAGESAQGTLRGLLISPVSRLRLVVMKAFGVLVVATLATLAIAVVGVLAGLVVVGTADGQLVTLSGSTVSWGGGAGPGRRWSWCGRSGSWPRSARWRWPSPRSPSTRWWCWPRCSAG